jgi:hypothetical protein
MSIDRRERSATFGKEMRKKLQHTWKPKLYKPSKAQLEDVVILTGERIPEI